MLAETLHNLHLAIMFNIATGVLNLLSIGLCLYSSIKLRKATALWRTARQRDSDTRRMAETEGLGAQHG